MLHGNRHEISWQPHFLRHLLIAELVVTDGVIARVLWSVYRQRILSVRACMLLSNVRPCDERYNTTKVCILCPWITVVIMDKYKSKTYRS